MLDSETVVRSFLSCVSTSWCTARAVTGAAVGNAWSRLVSACAFWVSLHRTADISLLFGCLFVINKKKWEKKKGPILEALSLERKPTCQLCARVSSWVLRAAGSKGELLTVCHVGLCRFSLQVRQGVLRACYKGTAGCWDCQQTTGGWRWVWVRQENSTAVLSEWQICG